MAPTTFEYKLILDSFIRLYDDHERLGERLEISKKDTVIKLKNVLIKEAEQDRKSIDPEKISARIANDLKGRISPDYVRKCLGDEFKDQSKVRKPVATTAIPAPAIMVTADGDVQKHESSQPPRGEIKEEKRKREFEEWQRAKYTKVASKASNKLQYAERKAQQQQSGKPYTGPSIGEPKEQEIEEEQEKTYFISITDTDLIDEIVLLRIKQNVMRIKLEVSVADNSVISIRK
jgi:hypothetical protein